MKFKTFFFLTTFLVLTSCIGDSPESYFSKTVLNVNRYISFGANDFENMKSKKDQGMLTGDLSDGNLNYTDSYVTHIETNLIQNINSDIENVKTLKVTDETKSLIDSSLEVYSFIKQTYETDYLTIAKMLDNGAPQEQIDNSIALLQAAKGTELDEKRSKLIEIAKAYAKENNIDATFR